MKKKSNKYTKVYQIYIELYNSSPNIWRRIVIPKNYKFWDLHIAIQNAMGWDHAHLHEFIIPHEGMTPPFYEEDIKFKIGDSSEEMIDFLNDEKLSGPLDEIEISVSRVFSPTRPFFYMYDFGDGWNHKVIVEDEYERESDIDYPICIGGEQACPPEDCGGLGGYYELQKILDNPHHKEHKEVKEWLSYINKPNFNPSKFDAKEVVFEDPKVVMHQMYTFE